MTAIDLALRRGDTFMGRLTITRDDAAADLTGCTLKAMIKADGFASDADATLTFTAGAGLTVIDLLTGTVDLKITGTQVATLSPSKSYVWDFQVLDPAGDPFTACGGDVVLSHDVVRATS